MIYERKTENQLRNWLSNKKSYSNSKKNNYPFEVLFDVKTFLCWYRKQTMSCHYCGLTEEEQFQIIVSKKITSKRFFIEEKVKRGRHLEIDRKNPEEPYSEQNCVLSCYFCNNDKSDVFSDSQFFKLNGIGKLNSRVEFLKSLID
jgi:5-methylcytosine-specific restriction endonuclease McrA